ncbi:sulfatase family protein [Flavilitoribacter nigricans]|uniref:Choline-sulfatase n=1 Tax=Flavilitoribacter nigricans (strain ATCC 23147 / DSM 23189 / NBRC 102662 / NCIMB 1420 / SS-2) TaxID=1122177 RepID=A0A2D0N870_FLAN2|nr:sulfatase-like hydrolase/transferase [Flavilitoribacter nigricans]PHN04590.1 choline-sulfatase [Flavilitoribacter nigricans DSM 23189 = NBRC 102662]
MLLNNKAFSSRALLLFLAVSSALFSACSSSDTASDSAPASPNVLLIFTDQQHIDMMSATGNPYLHTPNMDRLARRGVMFRNAYCTSPVCGPARSSIVTGRMPHETGVEWNGDSIRAEIQNVGELFRQAGYRTTWGGKWHLPESYPQRTKARHKFIRGFDLLPFKNPDDEPWMLGAETDPPLTRAVVDYLGEQDADQPFFLAVSYHNPHDICFYARKDGWVSKEDSLLEIRHYGFEYRLPDVVGTHPEAFAELPPLPPNHAIEEGEPEFITTKRHQHDEYGLETKLANQEFGPLEWRGYLNAYLRLTEMVDAEIGQVLDALEANGLDDNTIIVFTSDHGDGAAAHKWSAKLSLYREASMVPMLVSLPGTIPAQKVDERHLVSQIDIAPTLCDYAGIPVEVPFTGKSLRPILERSEADWRDYIIVELADYKPDPDRKGRMVRTDRFKYTTFTTGARNEQFFDLEKDPGETQSLIGDPAYEKEIEQHREMLRQWMEQTDDHYPLAATAE